MQRWGHIIAFLRGHIKVADKDVDLVIRRKDTFIMSSI